MSKHAVENLLLELRRRDVSISAEGDRLRIRGPKGTLDPALQDALKRNKEGILSFLRNARRSVSSIVPVSRGESLPLSFAQERLWFLDQLDPQSPAYNMPLAVRLRGALDLRAFTRSINGLVARHEALRTTIAARDGQPMQVIAAQLKIDLPVEDLRAVASEVREEEVAQRVRAEAIQPFDLALGPLVRGKLLRLAEHEHVLLLTMHHIVSDGWSMDIFFRELAALYQGYTGDRAARLPELPVQYADFAVWQQQRLRGEVLETQLTYWRRQLEALPALELPTDRLRPPIPSYRGASESYVITGVLLESVRAFNKREGITAFMALLAAFKVLLYRYTGQEDVVVGTPIAGRTQQEVEGLIGLFLNTLVLRTDLGGRPTFREVLGRVRDMAVGAFAHQDLPFEKLVAELHPERDLSRNPLYEVFFNYVDVAETRMSLPPLEVTPVDADIELTKFDLTCYAFEAHEGLFIRFTYSTDLFEADTIRAMLRHYRTLLEAAIAAPDRPIAELPLLSEAERRAIATATHRVQPDRPFVEFTAEAIEQTLPARFAEQVRAHGRKLAIVTPEHEWTYGELDRLSERVARGLLARLGAEPARVALLFEHGAPMVAAILGVLKAGMVYVPLDPMSPTRRLEGILSDAEVNAVVADPGGTQIAALLSAAGGMPVIDIKHLSEPSGPLPEPNVSPTSLAYLLYTSGSTGEPKGVMQSHRNVLHHVRAYTNALHLNPDDRMTLLSSYTFDAAVVDIFGALLNGATLCPVDVRKTSVEDVLRWLDEQQIAVYHSTPTVYRHLLADSRAEVKFPTVRLVVLGGEEVHRSDYDLYRRHFPEDCLLVNGFGATESTFALQQWLNHETNITGSAVPVGYPVLDTEIVLLDDRGEPNDLFGEIAVVSEHVALGYWRRPELTDRKFKDAGHGSGRVYRTGDVGRRRADGSIAFLGRLDGQVKLRGLRIELGEIEAALGQHATVAEAAVVLRTIQSGESRLAAYVVASPGAVLDVDILRRQLRATLPEYMVPAFLVSIDALPLTTTGKVDRRVLLALPEPEGEWQVGSRFVPPRGELEERITEIWKEVLVIDEVGVRDSFFDLGGHSLLLAQVRTRLEALLRHEVPMVTLFRYPTVELLAGHFGGEMEQRALIEEARARVGRRRAALKHDSSIAIVGMAGRFPGATCVEEFWENLARGVESIRFFSEEDLKAAGVEEDSLRDPNYVPAGSPLEGAEFFDAAFFGYTPREAELLDPQQRIFLECAWEALERAGYDTTRYKGLIGVYAGSSMNTYMFNVLSRPDLLGLTGGGLATRGSDKDYLPMRVSYKLDLRGPSVNVQTTCSTSLVAVHEACRSLVAYECDLVLAGGVTVSGRRVAGYVYQKDGIVSPDGHCRAFDAAAQGTVFGEGVGVVVLKRLTEALEDGDTIHAVVLGTAVNNDGSNKVGFTAPSVDAQAEVVALAQASAGVDPDTISYVEAHGTGTALGDPIEMAALDQAFGKSEQHACAVGTVKSNVGHLDRAAGIAGLIKVVMALEHRQLPPSLHFSVPNPEIDFGAGRFYVNTELQEWQSKNELPRRAGVSSFGMGGTNVHAIVEEAPEVSGSELARDWQLLVLSAKTATALEAMTLRLADHLESHPELPLADVAYTLQVGRRQFGHRRALACRSGEEAVAALRGHARAVWTCRSSEKAPEVVFMFPGQGTQHVNMGRELYGDEPVFRKALDACCEQLEPRLGMDLRTVLYPEDDQAEACAEQLKQTALTQPALFVVEYALAQQWMAWGIRPAAMIGHSIGEYVAACLAGVMSLNDALAVVVERGRLMGELPGGAMLAVTLDEGRLCGMLDERLSIAGVNGPELCVVSGPNESIDELARRLTEQGLESRRLHTSHAFHSPMMEPALESFAECLRGVELNPPIVPYVSNMTGDWVTAEQTTDPEYYARHLRGTVRFSDGLETLFADERRILVEVGPGRTLTGLADGHPKHSAGITVVPSQRTATEERHDAKAVLEALGRLWVAGVEPEWYAVHRNKGRRRVELPTYPFERQRYWVKAARGIGAQAAGLTKRADVSQWFYAPSWQRTPAPDAIFQAPTLEESGRWLLFADDLGLADALRDRLLKAKQSVSVVRVGTEFKAGDENTYTLQPLEPTHYDALVEALEAGGRIPERIVHLWGVTVAGAYASDALVDRCFYSPMRLVQAMGRRELGAKVQLTLVSNDMQDVAGDETLCPEKATAMGPCRVIPFEYPNVVCRSVDVRLPHGGATDKDLPVEALWAELVSEMLDPVVAYRSGYRWVPTYAPVQLAHREAMPVRLRERGVYLVTGGLGGIGLTLAAYLARAVAARLVLVGRTGLPPVSEWEAWLAAHGENDATSRRIRAVRALEADGAEVMVVSADVADRAQMQQLIEPVHRRFGKIDGVIHSAGVAGGGLIQLKTPETAASVLAPKVAGTLVLSDLLRDEEPDFVLLCSSRTALTGAPGQIDYTAANAFLDAFALQQRKASAAYTVSVNWPAWSEVGMAVETEVPDDLAALRAEQLAMGIRSDEGSEAFRRILGSVFPQVIVSPHAFEVPAPGPAHSAEGEAPEGESTEVEVAPRAGHARPSLATEYVAPRNELERSIAQIWEELFGIDRIGIHDGFFDLGGHSLLAMQLLSRLRGQLQVDLSLESVFESPTVTELAKLVAEQQGTTEGDEGRVTALRERLKQLSADERQNLLEKARQAKGDS